MKNYLAKLRENEEKGFSLVELIIVMAIMAILVGVVASQVIPYMEKSRQSKDQQQLSSLCTDIVSAISQADTDPGNIAATELKMLVLLMVHGEKCYKVFAVLTEHQIRLWLILKVMFLVS